MQWFFFSWAEVDSNHRSNLQQIYSLSPLATRESIQMRSVVQTAYLFILAHQHTTFKDFAENFGKATLEIVDETFGYNETKLEGYLYRGKDTFECSIGIYHMGDMSYLVEASD